MPLSNLVASSTSCNLSMQHQLSLPPSPKQSRIPQTRRRNQISNAPLSLNHLQLTKSNADIQTLLPKKTLAQPSDLTKARKLFLPSRLPTATPKLGDYLSNKSCHPCTKAFTIQHHPALRESTGNRPPITKQNNQGAHRRTSAKHATKSTLQLSNPGVPLETDPKYIEWLWNFVSQSTPGPATMSITATSQNIKNPPDPQDFASPTFEELLSLHRITIDNEGYHPELWNNIKKDRTKASCDSSVRAWAALPTADNNTAATEIRAALGGSISEVWEELRKHILLSGHKLVKESSFRTTPLTQSLPRGEATTIPADITVAIQSAITRKPSDNLYSSNQTAESSALSGRKTTRSRDLVTASSTPRHRNQAPRAPFTRSQNLPTSRGSAPSDPATKLPGLQLPHCCLDFQYALGANNLFDQQFSATIPKYTFVTEKARAFCPFFSIVVDDRPDKTDAIQGEAYCRGKLAVFAASALWNRLRLQQLSREKEKSLNVQAKEWTKFFHFGLAIFDDEYTVFLIALDLDEDLKNGTDWPGCKVTALWCGDLGLVRDLEDLRVFVDEVLDWGASEWKDKVKEELELLVNVAVTASI
ncbi:hypothetical protein B0J14DRAFT_644382 [Halenospora varia]|nr:hypothetical protein B0J14DRAFT_644382 [Halenospora varia]